MKHLLTAIACFFALSVSAQTPVTYNPDADGDGFVGSEDLLVLLTEFGTSFTPFFYNDEILTIPNEQEIDNYMSNWGSEGFLISEVAPAYLIDLREWSVDFQDYCCEPSPMIFYYVQDETGPPIDMPNGTQFWIIGPMYGGIKFDIIAAGAENDGGYPSVSRYNMSGLSLNFGPAVYGNHIGKYYAEGFNEIGPDLVEYSPSLMMKYIWLNGEMVFMH